MGKIRHIAIRCEDTDATAQWLQDALELQFVQRRGSGAIDLSDGDVNITLLPLGLETPDRPARAGFDHIGVSVADDEAARQRLLAAGATELSPIGLGVRPKSQKPSRTAAELRSIDTPRGAAGDMVGDFSVAPLGDVYYEAKFKSPQGLIVDVGHWAGTSPIPQPDAQPRTALAGE